MIVKKNPWYLRLGIPLVFICLTACQEPKQTTEKSLYKDDLSKNSIKDKARKSSELWAKPTNALANRRDLAFETEIKAILDKLTLEQKIGQMVQPQLDNITPEEVKQYQIGSVLNGGNAYAKNNKYATAQDWLEVIDSYYFASMDTSNGRVAIPITWGTDAVHGHNKIIGATIFPHNIGLGATRNPALVRQIAEITAKEMLVTGIDWTFAPSVAVIRDDRWGRSYEGFAEDPEVVALLTRDAIEGLQGSVNNDNFMDDQHVMATAKHFIGDGGTQFGVDRGDTKISEEALYQVHAQGYVRAIEAGVLSIMVSHNLWQGERMHGHKYLLTDVLKGQLGFDGFLIGDWNAHGMVPGCSNDSCPQAINAGLDMFMVTEDWRAFIANTAQQVRAGQIPLARIDDAVTRILRAKFRSGLFAKGAPSARPYANRADLLGSPAHRAVARQAVRESLVLLKNNNGLLPLKRKLNVLVAGDAADNIGKQAGGWTISWLGTAAKNSDFPNGESILTGIKQAVESAGGVVSTAADATFSGRPDVAIVAIGEDPYAEWFGDLKHISYQRITNKDAELLESLRAKNIPVVTVFISGRPLWVNRLINASDAFVAAWLPGTEGGGIADLLFSKADGTVNHDFTGKLSFTWPMYPSQASLNRGDDNYQPLFPYGYGLSVKSDRQLAQLEVQEDIAEEFKDPALTVFDGRPSVPWYMGLIDAEGYYYYPGGSVKGKHISMRESDKNTQGDAVEIEWLGSGEASVSIANLEEAQDYAFYKRENSAITFDVNVLTQPTESVLLQFGTIGASLGVDIAEPLKQLPAKKWQQIAINLSCYGEGPSDFENINNPFTLLSAGQLKLQLANIKITPGIASDAYSPCTQ